MRILLDTHVLLWAVGASHRLSKHLCRLLEDTGNDIYFSAASIWEIAIKNALGREDFRADPAQILEAMPDTGFSELPVKAIHAAEVALLPAIHKDPFDRLLVAQSRVEPMLLLTNDEVLRRYTGNARLIE
jgi:PIN domain nuclease of toxin-antitoxin system